jgi:hypothetical protein
MTTAKSVSIPSAKEAKAMNQVPPLSVGSGNVARPAGFRVAGQVGWRALRRRVRPHFDSRLTQRHPKARTTVPPERWSSLFDHDPPMAILLDRGDDCSDVIASPAERDVRQRGLAPQVDYQRVSVWAGRGR